MRCFVFALTFRCNLSSKDHAKAAERSLLHFGSLKKMWEATAEEIEKANGKGAAKKVEGYFRAEEEGEDDGTTVDGEQV